MKKVLIITNIPTPYRIPLFNELSRQLKKEGIELKVIFGARGYSRRKWKIDLSEAVFEYGFLAGRRVPLLDEEKTTFTYSPLYRMLSREKPDLIITNAFSLATVKIWFRSWLKPVPFIIWSGAVAGWKVGFMRKFQRKILVGRAAGFISYGSAARDYLVSLGAPPEAVSIGINTVDTAFFEETTARLREEMVIDNDEKHLLYIGNLTVGKRIDNLFKMVVALHKERTDFVLDLVGDGPEMATLKEMTLEMKIEDKVNFHGFKQKEELPHYLARARCFLFPSEYDVWGLVLVEAMAAGLPCLASPKSGATRDLIKDGETGFVIDFSDVARACRSVDRLLDDPVLAGEMGQRASRFIKQEVSIKRSAAGFVDAANAVLRES